MHHIAELADRRVSEDSFDLTLRQSNAVLVGLWRGSVGQIGLEHYQTLIGQTVRLSGRVLEDPDVDKKGQTVLRLGDIVSNDRRLPGSV